MRHNNRIRRLITPADQARELLSRGIQFSEVAAVTGLSTSAIAQMAREGHAEQRLERSRPRSATSRPERYSEPEPMPEPENYRHRNE